MRQQQPQNIHYSWQKQEHQRQCFNMNEHSVRSSSHFGWRNEVETHTVYRQLL